MDIASIIGLVLCFCLIIFGIVSGDDGAAAIMNFIHTQSAIITFGGVFLQCWPALSPEYRVPVPGRYHPQSEESLSLKRGHPNLKVK